LPHTTKACPGRRAVIPPLSRFAARARFVAFRQTFVRRCQKPCGGACNHWGLYRRVLRARRRSVAGKATNLGPGRQCLWCGRVSLRFPIALGRRDYRVTGLQAEFINSINLLTENCWGRDNAGDNVPSNSTLGPLGGPCDLTEPSGLASKNKRLAQMNKSAERRSATKKRHPH
jgi:hypothetical protein